MESNRYNVFNNIHKGLRGMLFDIQQKVQKTSFSGTKAQALIDEIKTALYYFDEHANHEDRFILDEIIKQEPQIALALQEDHIEDHKLSEGLRAFIAEWENATTPEGQEAAGKEIFYALNDFIAFNLYHMNKEEQVLLKLLWKHYTDEEILTMEDRIVKNIPPDVLIAESRWMLRSLSTQEIAAWFGGMKANAPAEVFGLFKTLAHEELPADSIRELEAVLT